MFVSSRFEGVFPQPLPISILGRIEHRQVKPFRRFLRVTALQVQDEPSGIAIFDKAVVRQRKRRSIVESFAGQVKIALFENDAEAMLQLVRIKPPAVIADVVRIGMRQEPNVGQGHHAGDLRGQFVFSRDPEPRYERGQIIRFGKMIFARFDPPTDAPIPAPKAHHILPIRSRRIIQSKPRIGIAITGSSLCESGDIVEISPAFDEPERKAVGPSIRDDGVCAARRKHELQHGSPGW